MSTARSASIPATGTPSGTPGGDEEVKSTRERILDVALDLFVDKGFDKTSLREIAEKLGFSKAALYYHFASKADIFLALHQRLHDLAYEGLVDLDRQGPSLESWVALLDGFIDMVPANRKLIAMHERNRGAFEALHSENHNRDHEDLEEVLRSAMADPSIPVQQRLRMAFAFSGMMGTMVFAGEAFTGLSSEELVAEMKHAVHGVLGV